MRSVAGPPLAMVLVPSWDRRTFWTLIGLGFVVICLAWAAAAAAAGDWAATALAAAATALAALITTMRPNN